MLSSFLQGHSDRNILVTLWQAGTEQQGCLLTSVTLLYVSVAIYIEQLIRRVVVCFDTFPLLVKAFKMTLICLCLAKTDQILNFEPMACLAFFMRCFIT